MFPNAEAEQRKSEFVQYLHMGRLVLGEVGWH